MTGSLVRRGKKGKNRWALVLNIDTADGKRQQKWITFRGNKEEAAKELTAQVNAVNRQEFVEPRKLTVGEWLAEWLEKSVKPARRARTYRSYKSAIEAKGGLKEALGAIRLQALKPIDLQNYYATHASLAPSTIQLRHAVLSTALKSALKNGLITKNIAPLADGKPRVVRSADDIGANALGRRGPCCSAA